MKFSEDSANDKETLFVRQNTPHPKELKAKAHKLFSKDKKGEDDSNLHPLSEEVSFYLFIIESNRILKEIHNG